MNTYFHKFIMRFIEYNGFEASTTMEQLRRLQEDWVIERNWTQYHSPRNLVLALVGEVGELAELFQWQGEIACSLPGWSERRKLPVPHICSVIPRYCFILALQSVNTLARS
jgi:dCTP diphosphatase